MKDENIKEILDYFIKYMSVDDCIRLSKIEDYITNLQEELEEEHRIEQQDFKLIQELEEKITNLQKENERLNNVINELEKWLKDYINLLDKPDTYEEQTLEDLQEVLDKLNELKEGK